MLRRFSICLLIPSLFVVSVLTGVAFARDGDSKTAGADDSLISVGVARIDVTPDGLVAVEGIDGLSFDELARLHSDDGSASKGGDLGWINPGDTVPDFEKAMNELAIGEISEPVQSPFGWHLIQVLERREQDVTQERQKLQARQAIRERKAEEAFQDWVRQIRDSAYVELRPID